jgi:hypothetical protein
MISLWAAICSPYLLIYKRRIAVKSVNKMKKTNLIIVISSIVVQLILAILYHFSKIEKIDRAAFIVAIIAAVLIVLINAVKNWSKAVFLSLATILLLMGSSKVFVSTGYSVAYAYAQINNNIAVNKIVSDQESYKLLFSYNGYDYYTDVGYTYLYKIKKKFAASEIEANSIRIEDDISSVVDEYSEIFYAMGNNDKVKVCDDHIISFSLVKEMSDSAVFLKIITGDNKVYYTYFNMDDIKQFMSDMNLIKNEIQIGKTTLALTPETKIINGSDANNGENVDVEEGKQFLLTMKDGSIYTSEITLISFADGVEYPNRVNFFVYKEIMQQIEAYQKELEGLPPETSDYEVLNNYIIGLQDQIVDFACELICEVENYPYVVRLYRIMEYGSDLTETPSISIIEIKTEDYYIYALTELEIEDLI